MSRIERTFIENSTVPSNREYPFIAAAGIKTKPYTRNSSLNDLILGSQSSSNMGRFDPNLENASPASRNELLDIPSFLYYPQDLGTNQRYHHFIVFNIYQGTSDEVKVKQRVQNQATSAMLAAGSGKGLFGSGFGGAAGSQLEEGRRATMSDLARAGFSPDQIQKLTDAIVGATSGVLVYDGITSDERINTADYAIQGGIQNLFGANQSENGDGIVAGTISAAETAWDVTKSVGGDIKNILDSTLSSTQRDYLDPSNQPKRNYEQVGVSGRKINRSRWEQNILLANRRFNFANVKSKDTICLYMPQKISFNDNIVYSEEEMGVAKSLLDTYAGKRGAVSSLVEKGGTSKISDLVNQGTNMVGLENANVQGLRNAVTRSVANPRREAMFKDVGLRTHSFTFEFAARNETEAQTVLDIIRMLRYHAYPGLRGGGGHFFTFPAEFEATFYTITENGVILVNDNLPKMPRLALQSVSVDYSNSGDFKTFSDAKPAFIRVDLQFQEMEQLTNEHIIHGY